MGSYWFHKRTSPGSKSDGLWTHPVNGNGFILINISKALDGWISARSFFPFQRADIVFWFWKYSLCFSLHFDKKSVEPMVKIEAVQFLPKATKFSTPVLSFYMIHFSAHKQIMVTIGGDFSPVVQLIVFPLYTHPLKAMVGKTATEE